MATAVGRHHEDLSTGAGPTSGDIGDLAGLGTAGLCYGQDGEGSEAREGACEGIEARQEAGEGSEARNEAGEGIEAGKEVPWSEAKPVSRKRRIRDMTVTLKVGLCRTKAPASQQAA